MPKNEYKFTELNQKSKNKAVDDYQKGWLDTHPNDPIETGEIHAILSIDLNHYSYNKDGSLLSTND